MTFVVKYFYDQDHVNEEIILKWFNSLDKKQRFYSHIKPFTDWLQEAEEATTSDDDDESD